MQIVLRFHGEYIIVKDNYNTSSAPNSDANGIIVPIKAQISNTLIHIMQEELIYMEHFTE